MRKTNRHEFPAQGMKKPSRGWTDRTEDFPYTSYHLAERP